MPIYTHRKQISRFWTKEKIDQLWQLCRMGNSTTRISIIMGRARSAISNAKLTYFTSEEKEELRKLGYWSPRARTVAYEHKAREDKKVKTAGDLPEEPKTVTKRCPTCYGLFQTENYRQVTCGCLVRALCS